MSVKVVASSSEMYSIVVTINLRRVVTLIVRALFCTIKRISTDLSNIAFCVSTICNIDYIRIDLIAKVCHLRDVSTIVLFCLITPTFMLLLKR